MLVLGRWLKRRHGVQLRWPYHLFAICIAVDIPTWIFDHPFPGQKEVAAGTVILGALFFIAIVDRYVWDLYFRQKHRVKVPRFLSEVVTLIILVIAFVVVLKVGYQVSLTGLLIAPGILAVILGLAMQDLLGNIMAGLALQFGNVFKDGDWLFVDNKYAQVVDINWRSTRLLTNDAVSIDIPNRELAKMVIVNLSQPKKTHAMRISVNVDYAAPPTRVRDILLHASANAKGVLPDPRPAVYLKNFGEYAVEYEIKFWMTDHTHYNEVCDAIRTNVWYALQRHGIKIPFPIRTVHVERPVRSKEQKIQTAARMILRRQPLFKNLSDAQLDALLPRGRHAHFGRGEKLIQQGAEGESMFILVHGQANVVVEKNGADTHVASLSEGDCFGEMSLLTGEPRSATVLAHTDCEVVEIGKPVLGRSLKENPELLEKLSELLAKRRLETEGVLAAHAKEVVEAKRTEYTNTFLDKLRVFFEL